MSSLATNQSNPVRRPATSASMRAVQTFVHAVDAGSPAIAARLTEQLMFRTSRRASPPKELEWLADAEPFSISSRFGDLAAWSWGHGPTILLVHGWNGRGSQLGAFVPGLVTAGFRVVTFDAPGHGESPGSSATFVDFVHAIASAIDTVLPAFGSLHGIVAHSMGGPATVVAAAQFRASEPGLDRAARELGLPARRFVFIAPPIDVRDFLRATAEHFDLSDAAKDELGRRVEKRLGAPLESLYAPLLVRDFEAPLLLIHDRSDPDVPLASGRALAEAWPGSDFVVTEGLGHHRILRDRGVVHRVVDFLNR